MEESQINTNKTRDYRNNYQKKVARSINEFLSDVSTDQEFVALIELAAGSMSNLAWMFEGDVKIEWLFEQCRETTFRNLKDRADHLHSKLATIEARKLAEL